MLEHRSLEVLKLDSNNLLDASVSSWKLPSLQGINLDNNELGVLDLSSIKFQLKFLSASNCSI